MWFFAIIFIGAVAAIILSIYQNLKKQEESERLENERKKTALIPKNLNDEENRILQEIKDFSHKEYPTQRDTTQYIINKINKTFLSLPGWEIWDISIHQKQGQFERLHRGVKINESRIIAYDSNYGIGKVLSSNSSYEIAKTISDGSIYDIKSIPENLVPVAYLTSAKHCSCPDFRERQLPCKHMYSLAIFLEEHGTNNLCDKNIKPLIGLNIALAGKFDKKDGIDIREEIERLGGKWCDNINLKTSVLLCGNNPSQKKIEYAQEKNIDILGKDDIFLIFSADNFKETTL